MIMPKLRFRQFSTSWEYKKLCEVGEIINGLTYSPADICDTGLLVLRSSNIQEGQLCLRDSVYVNLTVDEIKKTRENDILICVRNGSRSLIGKNRIIIGLDKEATHGAFMAVFRGPLNRYVAQLLQTKKYYNQVYSDLGATINSINGGNLKNYIFSFPSSCDETTKIADFLSSADEKITLLNKQYDLLCQYKKGMIQKIFSQKLRFKDENGEEFPKWETCELKKFLIPTLREVKKPSEKFLSVGIRSHFKGTFHKNDQDPNKVSVDKLFLVHEGDFILNITFAWEGALAIAREDDHLGYVSHRFPTYTFKKEVIIPKFFSYIYTLPKFLTYLDLCSPGGAGRNRVLKKSEFIEIIIDRPCVAEQTKIANILSTLDDKIAVKKAELDTLKTWKQGLLQQMFV